MKTVLLLGLLLALTSNVSGEVSAATKLLVQTYAPLIWMHSEEVFNPSNADWYIRQMEVSAEYKVKLQEVPLMMSCLGTGFKSNCHSSLTDWFNHRIRTTNLRLPSEHARTHSMH